MQGGKKVRRCAEREREETVCNQAEKGKQVWRGGMQEVLCVYRLYVSEIPDLRQSDILLTPLSPFEMFHFFLSASLFFRHLCLCV